MVLTKNKSAIIKDLSLIYRRKGYVVIFISRGTYREELPELMLLRRGITTFIKVQQPGEELNKKQSTMIETLKKKGFHTQIVSNVDEPVYKMKRRPPNF